MQIKMMVVITTMMTMIRAFTFVALAIIRDSAHRIPSPLPGEMESPAVIR